MLLSGKERYRNWTKWINAIHIWAMCLVKFYSPDGLCMNTRPNVRISMRDFSSKAYTVYIPWSQYIYSLLSPTLDIFPYVRISQRLLLCFLHYFCKLSLTIYTLKQLLQSCFPEHKQHWCDEKRWKRPFTFARLLQINHLVVLTFQRGAHILLPSLSLSLLKSDEWLKFNKG